MKLQGVLFGMLMLGSAALTGCKSAEATPAPQDCPSVPAVETAAAAQPVTAPSATEAPAANNDEQPQQPKRKRGRGRGRHGHRGMGG